MTASLSPAAVTSSAAAARPRFLVLLRGELFKIAHLRITWVMAAVYALFLGGAQLVLATGPGTQTQLRDDPLGAFYNLMEGDLQLVRIFGGIFLLVLGAHVVGLEYQQGTIRVLLGRGVGRLQLLFAKVAALAAAGAALLALGALIEAAAGALIVPALAGGGHPWTVLGAEYWADVRAYALGVLISAGVTLLLAVAAAAVGRSLAFGLAVGLSWFAVDNLAMIPLNVLVNVTHSDFWRQLSGYLLGPLLNRLSGYLAAPYHVVVAGPHGPAVVAVPVDGFGVPPLVSVSAGHALAVIAGYAAVFAAAAILPTWRRDVLE
jgi:ABC-type transport system involved in multi-copper enzyme maturation permease subunit